MIKARSRRLSFYTLCIVLAPLSSMAISPTWTGATNSVWSVDTNWISPATAPGLTPTPFDTAIFDVAANTTANNTGTIVLNTLQFNAGAPAYSITNSGAGNFTLSGSGILNNSSNSQVITNSSPLLIRNTASAGTNVTIINNSGGTLTFQNTPSADNTTIVNNGGASINLSGVTNGATLGIGSLSGAGNVTGASGRRLQIGALNQNDLISGSISGGNLFKVGTGTLTFTGSNSYVGTTVSAGTLQIGNGGTTGIIVGGITDNAAIILNRSDSVSLATLTGTGSFTKLGAGTLTAKGGFAPGSTTITAGTIYIVDDVDGSGGTLGGSVLNNSALILERTAIASTASTYTGVMSGSGSLTKLGVGTWIFTGDSNAYAGPITISEGTLQLGSGGTTGNITGSVLNNGTFAVNRSNTLVYNDVISGTGSLVKSGAGTLILTNTNTYAGGNTISAGTLQIGNGSTTGAIDFTKDTIDNGTFAVNRSDTVTYSGLISGTGSLVKSGAGTLILTGVNNSYSAGTTISGGILQLGNGGIGGGIDFTRNIVDNAALVFDRSVATTVSGVISGTGTLLQEGTGTLTLTGNNTYTGDTTISSAILQVGNGSTTGSLLSNIINNASLIFNRSNVLTYDQIVSGSGTLTQSGTGTLVLTGNNIYTGGTIVSPGSTLQLGGGGATGSVAGDITDDGVLTFNHSGTFTYPDVISGVGSLTQSGAGTTVLTGSNLYTGGTTISAGTLQIGSGGAVGELTGNILNNSALVVDRSNTLVYGDVISGTGTLTQAGAGTLTLTGSNTYTGDTSINAGVLQIGNGGTTGSLTSNITNNAALIFNRSNALTYGGIISGNGSVTKLGSNPLTFTGNNTYTGNTLISAGILRVGNGGSTGAVTGNITNNTAVEFNRADNSTYLGVIDGIGTVTKLGAGKLALAGDNTYTGTTTISPGGGTLQIGNGGTTGSVAGDILNNSKLAFNRSDTLTYGGVISGNGSVEQTGAGTTVLTGTNTYTGGSTLSAGALQIGNGSTVGSITGNIINNAALIFNRSDPFIYSGVISGTGSVTDLGAGTLTITANDTYTGDTTISAGTLQLGNGGTTGSVSGNILDNAALTFNHSNALVYSGVISGSGSVTKLGANSLTLAGNNTYTGSTSILNGTLQIGNGGTTGAVTGNITNNGSLVFNRSNQAIYDGIIDGPGTVTQAGLGSLVLNGVNTYTGDTTVSRGMLVIGDMAHPNAVVAGNVNINSGSVLNGFGTIGGNLTNNGSLSPGNSIGTITVNGNYVASPTSSYIVEINANGDSDLLNVIGTVTLDGTVAIDDIMNGFRRFYPYTIITAAGGVTGQFTNTDLDGVFIQNFLRGEVIYLPNAVQFIVDYNPSAFSNAAQTPNQQAVANYLLATGGTPGVQGLLAMSTTGAEFRTALDQISGATYANQTLELAHVGSWFEERMSDRFDMFPSCSGSRDRKKWNKHSYEDCNAHTQSWVSIYGANDQLDGGAVSGLITNDVGFAAGYERPVNDKTGVGAALGYNHLRERATDQEMGNVSGDLFQMGLYGYYRKDHWLFGGAVDAGVTDHLSASRQIQAATTIVETASNYSAYLFSEQARASYDIDIKHQVSLRPFVGAIAQQLQRSGFTEQGNINFTLNVDDASYYSLRSQVGAMLEMPLSVVRPFVSLAWEHEFGDDISEFNAKLSELTSEETFHIISTELGNEIAVAQAGVVFLQRDTWDLSAFYEGRFANSWQENSATLQLSVRL